MLSEADKDRIDRLMDFVAERLSIFVEGPKEFEEAKDYAVESLLATVWEEGE